MTSNNEIAWQQWQSQYGSPLKITPDVRYWKPEFTQPCVLFKFNAMFTDHVAYVGKKWLPFLLPPSRQLAGNWLKNVLLQDLVPSAFSFRIKVSAIVFKVNEINNQPSLAATLGQWRALLKILFECRLSFYGILITSALTRNNIS